MTISGHSTIGGVEVPGRAGTLRAVDARTGASLEPAFTLVGPAEVERATRLAEEAFDAYRATSPEQRAALLEVHRPAPRGGWRTHRRAGRRRERPVRDPPHRRARPHDRPPAPVRGRGARG